LTGQRKGVALAAVLLVLLLVAALVAGVFSATTEETHIGVAASGRQTALLSAESALEATISALPTVAYDAMETGETRAREVGGLGAPVVVYVTRLDSSLYWLVADAGELAPASGIARRIGVVVRARRRSGGSITIDRISDRGWAELF
jgi:Tfp pilus assembly protein PilX